MAENRYVGSYPVIGIRPTIDGRRGVLQVRESLEDQTMNMAKAAAKLYFFFSRYHNRPRRRSSSLRRQVSQGRCRYHSYSYSLLVLRL